MQNNTTNTTKRTHTAADHRAAAEAARDAALRAAEMGDYEAARAEATKAARAEWRAWKIAEADESGEAWNDAEAASEAATEAMGMAMEEDWDAAEMARSDIHGEMSLLGDPEEAEATIARIAETNPKAVSKDVDALLEMGEVDTETVLQGYLWDAVVAEIGEMDEETEERLAIAIVDYYCEQMDGLFDEDC